MTLGPTVWGRKKIPAPNDVAKNVTGHWMLFIFIFEPFI